MTRHRHRRPRRTISITASAAVLALAASCAGDPEPSAVETVVSIVEVPGPSVTVTSIVTQTSLVEVVPSTTADPRAGWPRTIVLGVVSPSAPGAEEARRAVGAHLGAALGLRVIVAPSPDDDALIASLAAGRVDLAALTPTAYVAATEGGQELELLAQSVQFGDPTYHSQWFTNDPSVCGAAPVPGAFSYDDGGEVVAVGPTDSAALQVGWLPDGAPNPGVDAGLICPEPVDVSVVSGKTVAFTTETSAIGYIFPTLQLRKAGIENDRYRSKFLGSHDRVVAAVYSGEADIGVAFDDARRTIESLSPDVGSKVIVFTLTPRAANDVLVARAGLPRPLLDEAYDALFGYIRTAAGQSAMAEGLGWTDMAPADAVTEESLATVADAMRELGFEG